MGRRASNKLSWLLFGLALIVIVLSAYQVELQPSTLPPTPVRVAPVPSVPPSTGGQLGLSRTTVPSITMMPKPSVVEASPVVAVQVPAIGLSLKVDQKWFGRVINPPFDRETIDSLIYQDTSRGSNPGTDVQNATYLAGHTWRAGHAAFNVIDTSLRENDDVYIMTEESERLGVWLHYVVTWQHLYKKSSLVNSDNTLWDVVPRLVFITCHLREDGAHQTDNRVFFADLSDAEPVVTKTELESQMGQSVG